MSDTLATPVTTTASGPGGAARPAILPAILADCGLGPERRAAVARQARTFFRRHWILATCAGALVLVLLAPSARLAKRQLTPSLGRIAEDKAAGVAQLAALARNTMISPVAKLEASGSVDADQGEESQPGPAPGFQPSPPMISRSVSLTIVAKDFGSSRAVLEAILARYHGYTASLTANDQPNSARSLQVSLRIPAAELSTAVGELKSLGRVENEIQTGEEVTEQHADLVARLKNSRETEQRLQTILVQRTGKVADVLAVEQEIARVRGEIEHMEAQQKGLEHRVRFVTIDLNLAEEYKAQIGSPAPAISTRLHNALVRGYKDAAEDLLGMVLFFAEYGPVLAIWLVFLLPMVWLVRRRWLRADAVATPLAGA